MKTRVGPISLFNIIVILVLLTLTFNSYKQVQETQNLIDSNVAHNLTYLQARSNINHFINDCRQLEISKLQEQYDIQIDANLITYRQDLDFGQTLILCYDYQTNTIESMQVVNDSSYQIDDQAPIYTGE